MATKAEGERTGDGLRKLQSQECPLPIWLIQATLVTETSKVDRAPQPIATDPNFRKQGHLGFR